MASKFDSRFQLPHRTTFSTSVIPKLKDSVHAFQMEKIRKMLKSESSMAFSTDGLDANDVDHSSIYDFSIYFYDKKIQREFYGGIFEKGVGYKALIVFISDYRSGR